jgi:hypothetical protein
MAPLVAGCSSVLLVAHNGLACDFRLVCAEMQRSNLELPAGPTYALLDTLHVIRKSPKLDYHSASEADWPARNKPTAAQRRSGKPGAPSMTQSNVADYVLRVRAAHANAGRRPGDTAPRRATFASYCGAAHDALADVRGCVLVLTDAEGLWTQRGRKLAVPLAPFWRFGERLAEHAGRSIGEAVPGEAADGSDPGWREVKAGEAPPVEEPDGPTFRPQRGCKPEGGPSMHLLRTLGLLGDGLRTLTAEELMLKLFLFYFDDEVVKLIVEATNSKAKEVVVAQGRSFRLPTASDPVSRRRTRALNWVDLTPGELYIFLGIRLLMGCHKRPRERMYWNSDAKLELELKAISDYMTRDRYEAILAQLSFMLVGETRFEGDKLAKLRELDSLLLSRCAQAWDIEQHFTIDESRVKSGSRYCPFIWTMYVSLSHASRPRPMSTRDELYSSGWT